MPHDITLLGAYVPALLALFVEGLVLSWVLDRILGYLGWYRLVWHPSLFRVSLFVCIFGTLGLTVYR
jgi:protein AaeX